MKQFLVVLLLSMISFCENIFSQVVSPNIRIRPNPAVQQFEVCIDSHPSNSNIALVLWNSIDTAVSRNRMGWSYTTNGGLSWSGRDTLPSHLDPGNTAMVDPAVGIDADGFFFAGGFYGNPPFREAFVSRSQDTSLTWSQTTMTNGDDADKPHMAIDINPGSPYRNYIYIAYTPQYLSTPRPLRFVRSTNRGQTLSTPIAISGTITGNLFAFGANLAVSADSELYAAWGGFNTGGILTPGPIQLGFAKSSNGGASWTTAQSIGTMDNIGTLTKGVNNIRAWSLPSMAIDRGSGPRKGWIYLVYAERNPVRPDVFLIRSTDRGVSWSSRIQVNQDTTNDQWHAWTSVDPATGYLYVVYFDSRRFAGNDSAEVYISASTNGGITFKDTRISDAAFLPQATRHMVVSNYIGSYIGISALQKNVLVCWNDNRTGFQQVYAARVADSVLAKVPQPINVKIPASLTLRQNFPNPFNPNTEIQFSLPRKSHVTLTIFDLLGRQVATLVSEELSAGSYSTRWDAAGFPSGVYLYRLRAGDFVETKKLLLLR